VGGKTHLGGTVDVMEELASLLGAVIVLIGGSIWRGRTLKRQAEEGAVAAVPARGIDLP
jgi:hypothetical protein